MTTNTVIPGCGMHHVSIQTHDWAASLRLYQDVLGMKQVALFGTEERPIMLLDIGDGSHIELLGPTADASAVGDSTGGAPLAHVALATTDVRASLEHVRQAGYEVTVEPKEVVLESIDTTVAFFKGPNGEIVEFFQVP